MVRAQHGGVLGDLHTLFSTGTTGGLADVQLVDRFASRGDEAAFAALVARHGPMVLAVCRGVLRRPHDVEDAFQATFLILARKAGTLRRRESLGGWLHQVARRVAVQAATEAARHRAIEAKARAGVPEAEEPPSGRPWDDVVPLLHEELARLPEKYRAPIVLCELESLTRDQAALQLGWPPGTVAGRLARGIALLRSRLSRRGVGPAAVAASLPAAREAGAAVPASWGASAFEVAAGTTPARSVQVLVEEALRAMIRSEIRRIAMTTLALGVVLAAMAAALAWARDKVAEVGPTMPVTGLVVDPDGRPATGAAVFGSLTRRKSGPWGEVVIEARTDGRGRFQLAIPTDPTRPGPNLGAIWAYQPGRLVASYEVHRGNVHGDVPLRLALGPPATTLVEVRDPGGTPVAGATIMPRVLNRGSLSVPDGLAGRIAADTVTDARGRVTITAFLPEEVSTVFVTAKGFSTQQFWFGHNQDIDLGTKVVNLMPTGKVEGRVVGEPETIRGVALTVVSWSTRSNPPQALGYFSVTTDDEGRFVLPEVPVGNLRVSGGQGGDRLLVTSPAGLKVEAGETTRVELKPTPGVRVHGVVREKGSGKPIPGVKVGAYSGGEGGISDASGRFTFYTRPGRGFLQLQSTPAGYAGRMFGLPDVTIPQDAAEFEFPPIELTRADAVKGVVHDGRGRPVPGATVAASWQVDEGAHRRGRREVSVTTDGRGAFSVADVPLAAAASLSATAPDAGRTARPVTARPGGEGEPVTLTLDPERLVAMKGRVVDTSGKPVAGARVHLRRQSRHETGQVKGDVPVNFAGPYVLRTDAEGRFETPRGLDAEGEYAAIAEADDFVPGQTPWARAADRAFPDLALRIRPERLVQVSTREGFVRDRSGRPVAGATAWASFPGGPASPGKITTDAQGRFPLIGLPPTGALVFVEAEGFRFRGAVAGPDDSPVKVTLTRINEPAAGMTTLPPPLPRADELALARGVIGPFAERVLKDKGADDTTTIRTLTVLATVDPARVLEAVAAKPFKQGWFNDRLRSDAALALLADSPDEALTVAESIDSTSLRSLAFAELCDRLPGGDRAGKLRLLDRALLAARGVPEPGHKVIGVARVAEHWIDLGETDRAAKLLREFEPVARALPTKGWDAYARGNFAEELAQIDPAAALKLIEGLGEGEATEPDRHRLNIAQELAGRDPAAAERALDGLKRPSSIVRHGPRIVHAMAPKDPARARRIADRMDAFPDDVRTFPFHHAYALGMMALALADTDKAAAKVLLEESYRELAGLAKEGKRGSQDKADAAVVAAALLPVAERIDPSLVPESFWRAASWRGTATAMSSRPKTMPDALLALLLARYDREVAHAILEPLVSGGLSKPGAGALYSLRAMAAIDPRRAVTLLDTVPDDPDAGLNPFRNPKNEARLDLAGALAARPENRWERAVEKLLHLWTVGREDIF